MAGATPNSSTSDQNINGLLQSNKWNALALTYNFPTAATYYPYPASGAFPANGAGDYFTAGNPSTITFDIPTTFEAATPALVSTINWALANQFSAVSLLAFTTVADNAAADHSFAMADLPNFGGVGFGPGSVARGGDAWFDNEQQSGTRFDVITRGDADWRLVLHEVGHTLGLKHGHELGGVSNVAMTADRDSMEFSVMTYRKYIGADPNNDSGADVGSFGFAQTLMMYDIAALQHMYGANFNTNSSGSTYTFSPTTGEMFVNGVGQGAPGANRIFLTIWDGDGIDTYNLSNYATNLVVDLTPGGWSNFNSGQLAQLSVANSIFARGNVFNALQYQSDSRSLIENATGGSGHDQITGNAANNTLIGNTGDDTLAGGDGLDLLLGGEGADTLWAGGAGSFSDLSNNTLVGGAGNDVLNGGSAIDSLYGDDGSDTLNGGNGIDYLVGGYDLSSDTLNGGGDGDNLYGFGGGDTLNGDGGDDGLYGGDGSDTLYGGNGQDFLMGENGDDFVHGYAQGGADDNSNDTLVGGVGNDTMHGGGGTDSMFGDDGADTLNGGAGIDYLVGGYDLSIDTLYGGGEGDNLYGFGGDDVLNGDGGGDGLYGGDGLDTMHGGDNDDFMMGEGGSDNMWGDLGNDTLVGGAGNDIYFFDSAWGHDQIHGFEDGGDRINMQGVAGLDNFAQLTIANVNGSTQIIFGGNTIFVLGIPPAQITAADVDL